MSEQVRYVITVSCSIFSDSHRPISLVFYESFFLYFLFTAFSPKSVIRPCRNISKWPALCLSRSFATPISWSAHKIDDSQKQVL